MISLLTQVTFLVHFSGCGLHYLSWNFPFVDENINWIAANDLSSSVWSERYLNSLYFSFVTLSPVSSYEKIYIIGCCFDHDLC